MMMNLMMAGSHEEKLEVQMDKQALIDNLADEYERFTNRVAMLPPVDIIARADVIAAYHFTLEYIKGEDFELSDIGVDTDEIDLEDCESIMDSLVDTFRFEADASSLHEDINKALSVVLEDIRYEQQIEANEEDEDEWEP